MKKFTVLLTSLLALNTNAQTWNIGYPNPADVTATLANDTLTISGTGAMQDFERIIVSDDYYYTTAPWYSVRMDIKALVINEGITNIGDWAFYARTAYYNTSITGIVTIPNSVVSIGIGAFGYCRNITEVDIPNSVTHIGSSAFEDCTNLTSIVIPNSVTGIESGTFAYCWHLTSVIIPNSVTYIGYMAFYGCESLTPIVIPNSVTYIGSWAFAACLELTSVIIPNSVTYLGERALSGVGICSLSFFPTQSQPYMKELLRSVEI